MTLWIPNDIDSDSQTMDIASTMQTSFGVSKINNDTYNNDFNEYYNQHIRDKETSKNTFCSKNGNGINVQYLIENANKKSYVTLLSLGTNQYDPNVLAILVFKWSPTASSVKIQAFCSNQKQQVRGSGTKLLNFLKKTLTHMGINNIYLNPIPNAVSYYKSQQFVEAKTPGKKIHDSSSPKPKSNTKSKTNSQSKPKSKSKSKSKSQSKPKSKSQSKTKPISTKDSQQHMPTMTLNIRATNNWKKTKTKMRSYSALTRKNHGKSYGKTYYSTSQKILLEKVDKILNNLSQDERAMTQFYDIITILNREGIDLTEDEEAVIRRYLENTHQIY
jgi:hypothetical protein